MGGDRMSRRLLPIVGRSPAAELLISPLVGEMSGRTEGGAKERYVRYLDSTSGSLRPAGSGSRAAFSFSASALRFGHASNS
ncbi:hypothetical protein CK218_23280 [Mesorhizobium sp. WSM3879]|nr:hypothetical protein CK218_23280 [Mesorhizobium sp. WSM3879]